MKTVIEKAAKVRRECFSKSKLSFEKNNNVYVVYQISNIFWITIKNKLIECEDIETLKELNKRCGLGFKIK